MAARKGKSAASSASKTARPSSAPKAAPSNPPAQPQADLGNRLLREAAWSRMFGRTDAKNPFAR